MAKKNCFKSQQLMALAQAHERQGQARQAEALYRQIVQTDPACDQAWHALGILAFNGGNMPLAIQCIEAAIAVNGRAALYHRNIGEMYRRMGLLDKAVAAGRGAVKRAPLDLDAHYNLGLAYTDAHDYAKAILSYRKAIGIDAAHGLSWNNLGSALEQQGDKTAALNAYEKAIAINRQHAEAQNNAGAIYSERGKLDEARACFQAAIACRPDFVEAHYNLSSLKTYTAEDSHLAMLEQIYSQRSSLSQHARIRYCFALGKALDDIGDYDRAFAAYDEGNQLQHQLLPMNEPLADQMLAGIIRVFDASFFAERRNWQIPADSKRTPIFIVGMPRSGTTLLEQILCSHGSVYGAGELANLNQAISDATHAQNGRLFTDEIALLSEDDVRRIGDVYLDTVWKLSPDSPFITDKMPANFFYLGLIHLALPHAKIIHAMRDPMDSCFSCFTKLFNDTMDFAYDQGTLGRYYARYIQLMRHWQRVLPAGTILDLAYEDMVADTEAQARRLLAFVGIPWDADCLQFHRNDRVVKTASVAQVRQPIYKTSVARWRHFARHLQPLYRWLAPYRPDDGGGQLLIESSPPPIAHSSAETLHLQGVELYRQGQILRALEKYEAALALRGDFATALNSYGFALQDMDRLEEALAAFEKSVRLAPEFAMARLNLGMVQLKLGDWENGWNNYEARWTGSAEAGNHALQRPACPLPQWDGQAGTEHQGLLIITEQGFGDTFQFCRYLDLVIKRFAHVAFACSAPTQRLLDYSYGDKVMLLNQMPSEFSLWQWQCPLLSLPRALGTRPESIPANLPYLKAGKLACEYWQHRLERAAPGRYRVGIAWAGRKAHQYDGRRSLKFQQLLPILNDQRISWVSLQKWNPDEAPPIVPESIDWLDLTGELADFADTAALINNLDLVISIDSAMVHLAGALNVPAWMLNRFDSEWRWFRHRTDSPWYPRLRIFNQPSFGDWDSVIADVGRSLGELKINAVPGGRRQPTGTVQPAMAPASQQTPGQELTTDTAMQLASQYQSAGRLQDAEQLLRRVLQQQPRHAHATHLLGVVTYRAGNPAQALTLMNNAIAMAPNEALFHSNLAEMYRQQGRLPEAIESGRRAIAIDPSMASAHSNLGIALYDAKQYAEAETCHRQALTLAPDLLQSINNLGSIERARKNLTAAKAWYRKALAIHPDYLESVSNLGAVLVEDDLADEAVLVLEKALALRPNYPEALCNLGLARIKQDYNEVAAALLSRSLQIKPNYPEAMIGLARAWYAMDRLEDAQALLRQVCDSAPDKADAWCLLATLYTERGESESAEAAYARALTLDAKMIDAMAGLGNLRLEQGKVDEAEALLQQALAIKPDHWSARFHLAQVKKVQPGDANLAALEAMLPEIETLKNDDRISLHYALGKAYDDLKEYGKGFPHYLQGARLKRATLHYDPDADAERVQRIIEVVDDAFLSRLQGAGDPSRQPVFVLGMPRSGSTLTEQIIASHPQVHGAGELRDLMAIVQNTLPGQPFRAYPDNLAGLDQTTITAWGQEYAQRLQQRAPTAIRITDKMPANYLALGLIRLMLPNAKIIHVKRHPVDTCVSCFTRLFNRHQEATYDLSELGRHYANYARLMQHWRAVLPPGSFMEVNYEDIVADLPGQARRLIDFCQLEWSDACLDFHKNPRNIRTASATQVRQPIYTSSVGRWRHYQPFLGPLLEGLGEFAPKNSLSIGVEKVLDSHR